MLDRKIVREVIEHFIHEQPSAEVIAAFAQALYDKFDLAFHFDDDFNDYVEHATQKRIFTQPEAEALNKILENMWTWCDANKIDIHEIAGAVQKAEFQKRGFLPKDEEGLEEDMHVGVDGSLGMMDYESEHLQDTPNDAYDKGREAFYKKVPKENNPYQNDVDVERFDAWDTGWAEAAQQGEMTEDIELTEDDGSFDKVREGIKQNGTYYDLYTQTIFTVDDITPEGFVCCTDVNDESNKWNVDVLTFSRYLKMDAYQPMQGKPKLRQEPALAEAPLDDNKASDPRYQIMELQGEALKNAINQMSRQQIIDWLVWNDRNGTYTDEDSIAEYGEVMPTEEGKELMYKQICEGNGLDETLGIGMGLAGAGFRSMGTEPNPPHQLFERQKPVGNEAEINRVYSIQGKNIKVVGIEAGVVRYRIESTGEVPAETPRAIPLEKFNHILQSGKMTAI